MADKDSDSAARGSELAMHYIGVILAVAVVLLGITYRPDVDVAAKMQRTASIARVQDNVQDNAAAQPAVVEPTSFEYIPLR